MVYLAERLTATFGALADPTRRAIVARLAAGALTISDLASGFEMTLPAVSKHVRVLEHARLVKRRVVGRVHLCRVEGKPLEEANEWLAAYRETWEQNFSRLDALLDEMQGLDRAPKAKRARRSRK